jgi:uncharacterized protein
MSQNVPAPGQPKPKSGRQHPSRLRSNAASIADAFAPYYAAMVEGVAKIYASNFTAGELRDIEAFYRQPIGQKLLDKGPAIAQQAAQVGQDIGRKAADDLRIRLTEALRQKGHKL